MATVRNRFSGSRHSSRKLAQNARVKASGRAADREGPENSRRNAARSLDWDPISELHQGQRSCAPHRRAGHMTAPDHSASAASKFLARGGRSLIASPLSIASCCFVLPYRGHGSLRGRKDPPQHLVRSTSAAMSTTGSHGVFMWPKALLRSRLHPRPVGQLSHPSQTLRMDLSDRIVRRPPGVRTSGIARLSARCCA